MHKYGVNVQVYALFCSENLRKSIKMCYFALAKRPKGG